MTRKVTAHFFHLPSCVITLRCGKSAVRGDSPLTKPQWNRGDVSGKTAGVNVPRPALLPLLLRLRRRLHHLRAMHLAHRQLSSQGSWVCAPLHPS